MNAANKVLANLQQAEVELGFTKRRIAGGDFDAAGVYIKRLLEQAFEAELAITKYQRQKAEAQQIADAINKANKPAAHETHYGPELVDGEWMVSTLGDGDCGARFRLEAAKRMLGQIQARDKKAPRKRYRMIDSEYEAARAAECA